MIYEYVVRLLGKSIVKTLYFLPMLLNYEETTLTIPIELTNPISIETKELIKAGFNYKLEYYFSLIINEKKLFKKKIVKSIHYQNGWFVDSNLVEEIELQKKAGKIDIVFDNFIFEENDHLSIFVKCKISDDEEFTQSTDFKTAVLWNYYIPQKRVNFIFKKGEFIQIEN